MKKLLCVLIAICLLAPPAFRAAAAEYWKTAPTLTLREQTQTANDKTFTFAVDGGDAAMYEAERRQVYDKLVRQYGSAELADAALTLADREILKYPAMLLTELETGGYTCAVGLTPITDKTLTVSLQKDILPAVYNAGLYTGNAFTFRLRFCAAIPDDGPLEAGSPCTGTAEFTCPATVRVNFDLPQDAENPNPAFPFTPFAGCALAYPTRPGYVFAGWTDSTGAYVDRVPADPTGLTFTANWTPLEYKINYVLATRQGYDFVHVDNPNAEKHVYGEVTPIYDLTPPYGYLFMGWYDNAAFTGDPVKEIPADKRGDTVLYAKWRTQAEAEDDLIAAKGWGDVNGDGRITAADARKVLRAAVKLEALTAAAAARADIAGNGVVNAAIARDLLRIAVRLENLKDVLRHYGTLPPAAA